MLPELVPSGCMAMLWGYIHVWNCEKVQNLSPCPRPGVRWALQDHWSSGLVYVNDISESLLSLTSLYADGSSLFYSAANIIDI